MNYVVLNSTQDLVSLLNQGKKVVVMASTTTCPPCKMFTVVFDEVAGNSKYSEIVFAKINLDEHPSANEIVGATSVPTVLFMRGTEESYRQVGSIERDKFMSLIDYHLS